MNAEILKIGMPSGSLADPKRGGNLVSLLENSGFKTSGYESGGPSKFSTINYLFGWDGRPQEFGSQLGINELDVAIAGNDWIKERILEFKIEYKTDIRLENVLSLNRGNVKIVGIIKNEFESNTAEEYLKLICPGKEIINVVAEMPYIALDWLQTKLKNTGLYESYSSFSVQKYKSPPKIKKGIVIYETWGKTEAKVKNEGADIGIEITQSGSALKNYGLKIIDTIMESETSIWINPEMKTNKAKKDLLDMFLLNLIGTVNAENKVMVVFNVSNSEIKKIEKYLSDNKLFADEPTMNAGKIFTEISIQVAKDDKNLPLAKIRYELAKLGAVNIDTIPIISSIKGMDAISQSSSRVH
jgi:ATP phosphoribosyltransferase